MKKIISVILVFLMAVAVSACNRTKPDQPTNAEEVTENNVYDEGTVFVKNAQELLEAIGPYTNIVIKEGYYNLSEYIEKVWAQEGEKWNGEHEYVKLSECYDGVEIVIEGVTGLVIEGGGEKREDTEIVAEPRYSTVLNFKDCYGIVLTNFTMGHTETGDCRGNVINFYGCEKISLDKLDLYGCGVYGLGVYEDTVDIYAYDCIIRDCSYGPFEIYGCREGRFDFRKCTMTGSKTYPYFDGEETTYISFYECKFGKEETEYIYYNESIYSEDCEWSDEAEFYGEYGGEDMELPDFDNMKVVPFDEEVVSSMVWVGACLINTESLETVWLPYTEDERTINAFINPYEDGTGLLEYCGEEYDITWYCDSDYTVCFKADEFECTGTMYAENIEGESQVWMLLHIFEDAIWMY